MLKRIINHLEKPVFVFNVIIYLSEGKLDFCKTETLKNHTGIENSWYDT